MRIGILGTRGIPNHYGGFEQCAEYLALGLINNGHEVFVYNSHDHPYREKVWQGVNIIHCYDPEIKLGTIGQFIYDLNCIKDSRKRDYDIILQLGYTSSSVWGWLLPTEAVITTNMDGLEWKRSKYSTKVRKFLLFAEKLGVKYSNYLISDSIVIQDYLLEKYKKPSVFIPYGAHLFYDNNEKILVDYNLEPYNYDMLIARLEPENNIELILDGVVKSKMNRRFLVIGKHETAYGNYLKNKFKSSSNINFIGGIYNIHGLDNLRFYSNLYFHGHTVGGTNPSLLEAMASNSLICAHNNAFNKLILGDDGFYFSSAEEVSSLMKIIKSPNDTHAEIIENNRKKIKLTYSWERIVDAYINHFQEIAKK